jgi:hypothetical protein
MTDKTLAIINKTLVLPAMAALCLAVVSFTDADISRRANRGLKEDNAVLRSTLKTVESFNRSCIDSFAGTSEFYSVLADVASVPYSNPGGNCYDHSKELQGRLAQKGIESSILINNDRSHAWVAVWIEANTGHFVSTDNRYGGVMEMRGRDQEVVLSR